MELKGKTLVTVSTKRKNRKLKNSPQTEKGVKPPNLVIKVKTISTTTTRKNEALLFHSTLAYAPLFFS